MAHAAKRKRAPAASGTLPITAFFERRQPPPALRVSQLHARDRGGASAVDSVEDIESDVENEVDTSEEADADVTVVAAAPRARSEQQATVNRIHVTRIVQRRELGHRVVALGVPCSGARRRRQQCAQRLTRFALAQFRSLPLELALSEDAVRVVQSHRLVSHCAEFYTSCLAFDAHGALLAAGSSNGVIALFDFDDAFHATINLVQRNRDQADGSSDAVPIVKPMHMIFTGMEVQRIRWNPVNEVHFLLTDEIACSFANRNEIYLYNLQKFPSKPFQVLKASSRPSSGYNDLVFLPPAMSTKPLDATSMGKKKLRTGRVIAGDLDGTLRMWDLRFPARPQWSVSTGSLPVSALTLSHDSQHLVCGTEGGTIVVYDVRDLVVPAFGSKPMPKRRAAFRLAELIKPCLSTAALAALTQSTAMNAHVLAITALHIDKSTSNQVTCQLRNQWVVVVDFHSGIVTKMHAPFKEVATNRPTAFQPASVLQTSAPDDLAAQRAAAAYHQRHSWLQHHRCTGALAFHGDMLCTGAADEPVVHAIDMNQLDAARYNLSNEDATPSSRRQDQVETLGRFRIDLPDVVTAIAAHPSQHLILCGGADLQIRILGAVGDDGRDTGNGLASSTVAEGGHAQGTEEGMALIE